jgi:hypothetical protein
MEMNGFMQTKKNNTLTIQLPFCSHKSFSHAVNRVVLIHTTRYSKSYLIKSYFSNTSWLDAPDW